MIWLVIGGTVGLVLLLAALIGNSPRNEQAWRELAKSLGLTVTYSPMGLRRIDGTVRGFHVKIEPDAEWIRVQFAGAVDHSLSIAPRETAAGFRVGDIAIDESAQMLGPETVLLAALDQTTRAELRELLAQGVTLEKGVLKCSVRGLLANEPREFLGDTSEPALATRIQRMLPLIARLQNATTRAPEWLAQNAKEDPIPEVRLRNLRALALQFAGTPEANGAAAAALEDSEMEVRVAGAEMLGPAVGRAALEAVTASDATDEVRAQAWALLARWGVPAAEAALLRLVESDSPVARVTAVRALGETGSIRAVATLMEHGKGLLPGQLHDAAREAVRAIQARQGNAGAGQLSVATEGVAGGLSLTPAGGELAVAPVDAKVGGERDATETSEPTRVKE